MFKSVKADKFDRPQSRDQFWIEGNENLSLFAEATSQATKKQSKRSFTKCDKKIVKQNLEETEPSKKSDDSSLQACALPKFLVKKVFRLIYLPHHLPEAEIIQKLTKFGQITDFNLSTVDNSDQKKQNSNRVPSFLCAEFSFKDDQSADQFSQVKRIRVRGLQVRVSMKLTPQPVPENKKPISKVSESEANTYSTKPTSRKYFANRSGDLLSEDSYYWRRSISRIQ